MKLKSYPIKPKFADFKHFNGKEKNINQYIFAVGSHVDTCMEKRFLLWLSSLVSKKPIFMCYFNVLRDKGQSDILHRLEERITNFFMKSDMKSYIAFTYERKRLLRYEDLAC